MDTLSKHAEAAVSGAGLAGDKKGTFAVKVCMPVTENVKLFCRAFSERKRNRFPA